MKVFCAWCGDRLGSSEGSGGAPDASGEVSHGICGACSGNVLGVPVTDVYHLDEAQLDCLPFGAMELAADGTVRAYNLAEAQMSGLDPSEVLGRNFFTEVAPCTRDTVVQRRFTALLEAGGGDDDISFVFRFTTGHQLVRIRMLVDTAQDRHMLLVQDRDSSAQ